MSDMKIYDAEFNGGSWEGLTQIVDAFNAPSANALRLVPTALRGEFARESFFKNLDSVARRDPTSIAGLTDEKLIQSEIVSVKLNRRYGPVANTLDSFKKIVSDEKEMSFILGKMFGQSKAKDMLNTLILAVTTALSGQAAINYNAVMDAPTGEDTTLTYAHLVRGLSLFGDAGSRVVAWVMHSKPFYDLMLHAIQDMQFDSVAGVLIFKGSLGSLNRPIIVSDSPSLIGSVTGEADTYSVLGLVENAGQALESEEQTIIGQVITGLANLIFRTQGEYAYNIGVKGFAWDADNGQANPTDAAIATTAYWDKASTSDKDLAGIRVVVN
jgi:hypothetical protein